MECPIASAIHRMDENRMRPSFDVFKSNICHQVKDLGDIPFIIELLQSNQIRKLYEKKWYPESLYLLAMPDYLSRKNNVPICKNYNDLRSCKLQKLVFPSSIVILCKTMNSDKPKEDIIRIAIPQTEWKGYSGRNYLDRRCFHLSQLLEILSHLFQRADRSYHHRRTPRGNEADGLSTV